MVGKKIGEKYGMKNTSIYVIVLMAIAVVASVAGYYLWQRSVCAYVTSAVFAHNEAADSNPFHIVQDRIYYRFFWKM